jgi:hypothetical protein
VKKLRAPGIARALFRLYFSRIICKAVAFLRTGAEAEEDFYEREVG